MGYDLFAGIQAVTSSLEAAQADAGEKEYDSLYSGHERHGVWEWRFSKQSDRLRRYVIVTVSNLEDEITFRDVQFYVGADDDRAFTKRLMIHSLLPPDEMYWFIFKYAPDAFQAAETLTEDDLDTLYNQRRYSSPDEASSPRS